MGIADLKAKLNAAAEAAGVRAEAEKDAAIRQGQTVMREYPGLCEELFQRVTQLIGDAKGVVITATSTQEQAKIGTVNAKATSVRFLDRSIEFTPAGVDHMGVCGAIAVSTGKRKNPFEKEKIFMVSSKEDPSKWVLSVADSQNRQHRHLVLTDEMLSDALEHALL